MAVKKAKYIAGFSGGIDSQACARWVLNRYPKEDVILTNSNAGEWEHPITDEHVRWYSETVHPVVCCSGIVSDMWKTPGAAEERGYDGSAPLDFTTMVKIKGRPPSRKAQFCTEKRPARTRLARVRQARVQSEAARTGSRRDRHMPRGCDSRDCRKEKREDAVGQVNREHVPEIGEVIYLRYQPSAHFRSYRTDIFRGETARSWILGKYVWSLKKYSKKKFVPCSKKERDEWLWFYTHRYKIAKAVKAVNDPAILRQIAALIGYEEGK